MLNPVRATAGWLAGRLVLLAIVTAALVAASLWRPQLEALGARAGSVLPDAEFVARLERARADLQAEALVRVREADARLARAPALAESVVDARIRQLGELQHATEARRRPNAQRTLALLTGDGLEQDLRLELDLRVLAAERAAWERVRAARALQAAELAPLERQATDAYDVALDYYRGTYRPAYARLREYLETSPAWSHGPLNPLWAMRDREHRVALARYRELLRALEIARAQRDARRTARALGVQAIALDPRELLQPLDAAIAERRATLATSERLVAAVRAALWQALAIVVALSLLPIAVKAFWYGVVAPWIARRAPLRLTRTPWPAANARTEAGAAPARERISAVSQEVVLREGEELLVHPEFLQSTADVGTKSTRWLLDWRLPLTSVAARLVALTVVRDAAGHAFVVSSKTDPLAEVGLVAVPAGAAFALQPRHLVGLVQRSAVPIRITRHWRFGASAWITLQFRYLAFHGPGTLIVQGCRGIRLEPADSGRSIDQRATIGFSANLAYAPRRTETFGAYLLGVRGLFNDHFRDGPGFYAYEEMPYAGRATGLTGHGLQGLADGLLRAFGV